VSLRKQVAPLVTMTTPSRPHRPHVAFRCLFALSLAMVAALTAHAPLAAADIPVAERDYRWLVGLHLPNDDTPYCSGVLVAPRRVVTAGHCVDGVSSKSSRLTVSNHTGGSAVSVVKIVQHPHHVVLRDDVPRRTHVIHDIAVIHLSDPISLSRYPELGRAGVRGKTYLYGLSSSRATVELPVRLVTKRASEWFDHVDRQRHVVAVSASGAASCSGDSGGGLVAWVDGAPVLLGVVSYGAMQCGDLVPTVFTKVAAYTGWIRSARR
jgi:secreted trypsin-like serine protease